MRTNPKVSVIMSVFNGEKYLREAIDSILNQTFKNFEFLIINDGSTDRTAEILQSYHDSRIKIINNEKNMGLTKSLNKDISLVKGDYIARQDADDISLPTRLEKQVEFLDAHPLVGVLGINSLVIDEQGNVLFKVNHPIFHKKIMAKLLLDNRFIHGSIMLRKTFLETSGYYNEDLLICQDYELFLRLSLVTQLANLPESLHKWRKNYSTGISVIKRPEQIVVRDKIKKAFLEKHFALNKDYVNWVLKNFQNNPTDVILSEYLHKISKAVSFTSNLFLLKLKILYYLTKGKILNRFLSLLSMILPEYPKKT